MNDDVRAAQARSRAQYAAVAGAYATSASHASGDDLAWFAARAQSVVPTVALDVACGGGFSTAALMAAGHAVLATDLTPESVVAARASLTRDLVLDPHPSSGDPVLDPRGPRALFASGAAEALPVTTGGVGLVGCRIAAHHFGDMAAFVDEVARVLRPGGMLLLVDSTVPEDDQLARWLNDVERARDPSHGRSWPISRWQAVCAGARLSVEEVRTTRKTHEVEDWLARSGCTGDRADAVRETFRSAPPEAREAFSVTAADDGAVLRYTDTKMCLRARR